MDDIIAEIPWCCGEKDCETQWHQANYWLDDAGEYTVDSYADGDHDGCDKDDVPDANEITEAWRSYACHVVETGNDPLGNYMVKRDRKDRQAWEFRFEPSPAGTVVTRVRRAGRDYDLTEVPERICGFLGVDQETLPYVIGPPQIAHGEMGAEALHEAGLGYRKWNRIVIEITVERDAELVARELRRLARRHLNQRGNR
jgi:hypothetical protein